MKIVRDEVTNTFDVTECNINKIDISYWYIKHDDTICKGCTYEDYDAYAYPCSKCIRNVGLNKDRYESEDEE